MRSLSPGERRWRRSHPDAAAEQPTASVQTIQHTGRAGWTMMNAIHDALRRDLDQLVHTAASRPATRARWIVFRDQLRFHFAAEHAAMWPQVRAKLTGEPHGQALLDAMEDERRLIGPLQAVTDDAFTMDSDPERLRPAADQAADQADQSPRPRGSRSAAPYQPDHVPGRTRRNRQGHRWRA
jgi:Hemerythrin HHE cation binding domain